MNSRRHLLNIQREMNDRLRRYARLFLGSFSPQLRQYHKEYLASVARFEAISDLNEVGEKLIRTDIALFGDYHTLPSSQGAMLKLFQENLAVLRAKGREVFLGLEMVGESQEPQVSAFLRGELGDADLKKELAFHRWGFDWKNYSPIFHFAKRERVRIFGLIPSVRKNFPTLFQRDRAAARLIAEKASANQGSLIAALLGDFHLAENHLPRAIEKELVEQQIARSMLILHQNVESFHWKLSQWGFDHLVDVVRIKKGVYCLLNTPPWLKTQSDVSWFDNDGPSPISPDEVMEWLKLQAAFFGLSFDPGALEIVSRNRKAFIDRMMRGGNFSPQEIRMLAQRLRNFSVVFIPRENLLFLGGGDIVETTKEAALFLLASSGGFDRVFQGPNDFFPFVWLQALAFVASKLVHQKHQPQSHWELLRLAHEEARTAKGIGAQIACSFSARQERGILAFSARRSQISSLYYASRWVGEWFGDRLYQALVNGAVTKEELRGLYLKLPQQEARAQSLYLSWSRRLLHGKTESGEAVGGRGAFLPG